MKQQAARHGRTRGKVALRLLGRAVGVGVLATAVAYGAVLGGHFEGGRLDGLSGTVAGTFGYAAQEIRISGLEWQTPPQVLAAIGVEPGGPLLGFEPAKARRALEDLDWVESARVHRLFPNQLEIRLVERQPFAIWQRDGRFSVIDEAGVTLSGIGAADIGPVPLVTGEGAGGAVAQLVNHLEAHPGLSSKIKAGARVGARRWNLYFDGQVKVLLPEHGLRKALAVLSDLNDRHRIFDRNISVVDLRIAGSVTFSPPPVPKPGSEPGSDPGSVPVSVAGVSPR